jgi:hypothetical protein
MAKEWEGNWLGPDGAVNVRVVDADKAILSVAWLEDDGQGKPAMKTAEVEVAGIRGVALRQHRGGGQSCLDHSAMKSKRQTNPSATRVACTAFVRRY